MTSSPPNSRSRRRWAGTGEAMDVRKRLDALEQRAAKRAAPEGAAPTVPFDHAKFAELYRGWCRRVFPPGLDLAERAKRWAAVLRFYGKGPCDE